MTATPVLGSVLQEPAYRRYLIARTLSGAGSVVTLIALPVLAYRITNSATLTGLVAACEAAPYLIWGLIAGAFTDRWNRKRTMILTDVLSMLLVASIPLAYAVGTVSIPHLLLVAFLGPSLGVFFDGAVFGAIPLLVGKDLLAQANSYAWAVQGTVEVVVPTLTGIALAWIHPAWLLGIDALTFGLSALLLTGLVGSLRDPNREIAALSVAELRRQIGDGLRFLWQHRGVRTMTFVSFVMCWSLGGFMGLWVVWVDRQLGLGTEGLRFGLIWGMWAIGQICGSLWVARTQRSGPEIVLGALPVALVAGLLASQTQTWWLAGFIVIFWAAASTAVFISAITYRQRQTPESLLGQVGVIGRMFGWGLGWTGATALGGYLVDQIGIQATTAWFAASAAIAVVVAWSSPDLRKAAPATG